MKLGPGLCTENSNQFQFDFPQELDISSDLSVWTIYSNHSNVHTGTISRINLFNYSPYDPNSPIKWNEASTVGVKNELNFN